MFEEEFGHLTMNSHLVTQRPTIYADMNVFRYVACGDISFVDPERFIWVYSHVHLDEICRNGNTDALDGMRALKAVEACDVLNEHFQSAGDIRLKDYVDPYERYERHLEAISGFEGSNDQSIEYLIRSFGADNFEELQQTPEQLRKEVDRLTSLVDDERKDHLISQAYTVSEEMAEVVEQHLKDRVPINQTRVALGVSSEERKRIEKTHSPIDEVWNLIAPAIPSVSKDQFFGFELIPGIEGVQHTQYGAICGAHVVLNMIGISPDKGLAKREKIKNIMSDGQHTGMASYCNALLSADRGIINKARCIYTYLGNITTPLHFNYEKGYILNLGIQIDKT
ncbi:hypothetical protein [Ectopseudomonas oleovorans]|uniref:hypothetical protein n=1 Tax=Ectopseudomonas oleovorans TaxID=301 RepID=UPI00244A8C6D|nr:hypothetical protein [Pseudomonas oleovorans]MDG9979407.1 hypothetical protein [Pseudomonas oleovorans]